MKLHTFLKRGSIVLMLVLLVVIVFLLVCKCGKKKDESYYSSMKWYGRHQFDNNVDEENEWEGRDYSDSDDDNEYKRYSYNKYKRRYNFLNKKNLSPTYT
jgi:hypothetical protein